MGITLRLFLKNGFKEMFNSEMVIFGVIEKVASIPIMI